MSVWLAFILLSVFCRYFFYYYLFIYLLLFCEGEGERENKSRLLDSKRTPFPNGLA